MDGCRAVLAAAASLNVRFAHVSLRRNFVFGILMYFMYIGFGITSPSASYPAPQRAAERLLSGCCTSNARSALARLLRCALHRTIVATFFSRLLAEHAAALGQGG